MLGSDGNFYGITSFGGSNGKGTVFKITPTNTITTLVNFNSTNGSFPKAGLIQGSDRNFYGTTNRGGSSDFGTVFKITSTGSLTTLVNFTATDGSAPTAGLVQGNDGNFYGTTYSGGTSNKGTVFRLTADGILTTMVNFTATTGSNPTACLVQGSDGNFYGTTHNGGTSSRGTVFKMTAGGTFTTLVNFNNTNGSYPDAGLLQASDGNFYGTTGSGGNADYGTLFKMTTAGTLTTLVNFASTNGSFPSADLLQGSDGNFYGTTRLGGNSNKGTVFKMTATGTLTTLVNFTNSSARTPYAGLVKGSDGHLYGTTANGGSASDGLPGGGGQIFRLRLGPSVTSQPQTNVTAFSATLNGMVNPGGYAAPVSFQYGTDPTLANYSTVSTGNLAAGTSDIAVQASVSGLQPGTTCYFRVLASNAENTAPQYGAILSFTLLESQSAYPTWASARFTPTQLADPLISGINADPDGDRIGNLLECAFNMPPLTAGNPVLTSGTGTFGLPLISVSGSGGISRLQIEYIRRKMGLTYTPQFSSNLTDSLTNGWATANGSETVEPIDSEWERVTVEDEASGGLKRFGRVRVVFEE